jgi:RNA polymerase sigma factor (sigma-70 family)
MSNYTTSNSGVSDSYALNLFIDVNNEDTLSNQELFLLFSKVNFLVKECVDRLTLENEVIQFSVLDLGAEVAGNTTRNKVIFRRLVNFDSNGKIFEKKIDVNSTNKDFLCQCMDLGQAICTNNVIRQNDIINNLLLSRMVFEKFIEDYLTRIKDYNSLCYQYADILANEQEDQELLKKLIFIEKTCSLDNQFGYGLVTFINTRMSLIKEIYEKIYRAYSRFVFKIAKSKANIFNDSVEDFFQYGSIGLMRAISSYDYLSPAKFAAFAAWWVKQQIFYHIKTGSSMIKMSSIIWQNYTKLESVRIKVESQYGANFDKKLLMEASNLSSEAIDDIYNHIQLSQVKSLESQVIEDDANFYDIYDVISFSNENTEVQIELLDLLEELPFELKKVIYLKFGIL